VVLSKVMPITLV